MKPKKNKSVKLEENKKPDAMPVGRPTMYSDELADRICREISISTDGLDKICRQNEGFPNPKTIYAWRIDNEVFSKKYDKAKRTQADLFAQEIIDISDNSSKDQIMNEKGNMVLDSEYVARSRLRVDSRKWIASRLLPKVYGDQKTIEEVTNENNALKEEMRLLRESLNTKHKKDF